MAMLLVLIIGIVLIIICVVQDTKRYREHPIKYTKMRCPTCGSPAKKYQSSWECPWCGDSGGIIRRG
ncbi:MAG: hypothetical protein Q4F31_09575 [Eubacteriales bacterium]|nr:hypothetical protein [Eubacteriales bacterium]